MAKYVSTAIETQLDSLQKKPINLFIMNLASGITLYYAAARANVTFWGQVYTAKAITYGNITQSAEGAVESVQINFDNTARDMAAYASVYNLESKRINIRRIYLGASGVSDFVEVFEGFMEEPQSITGNVLTISASAGKPIESRNFQKLFMRSCWHLFGDSYCASGGTVNITAASYTSTAAVYAGSTNYILTTTASGATSTTGFWQHGRVQVGNSGVTYNRTAYYSAVGPAGYTNYTKVMWNVELPSSETATGGWRVILTKGCPKTWAACGGVSRCGSTYDASATSQTYMSSNRRNFGGFIHIGMDKQKFG